MVGGSAVIFIPDDTGKTGGVHPLMLHPIMGAPLLSWVVSSMLLRGFGRFFLVCNQKFAQTAQDCFPNNVALTCCCDQDAADLLHVFLSTGEESDQPVLVMTSPSILVDAQTVVPQELVAPSGLYCLDGEALMMALDDDFVFLDFLRSRGQLMQAKECAYGIKSLADFPLWQGILNRQYLEQLAKSGVQIWDYNNCYVEPTVFVGAGTTLLPGTILRGNSCIGRDCNIGPNAMITNCQVGDGVTVNSSQMVDSTICEGANIGPFAYIRPNSHIGRNVKVGDFVEIKNANIGEGTKVPHLTYVGDSDVGKGVNFGCGSVTVNYDRAKKHRTTIGDQAFIGCNTNLVAPVSVGDGGYTAAGTIVTDDVPAGALAIGRAKLVMKKDWANRHKKKD